MMDFDGLIQTMTAVRYLDWVWLMGYMGDGFFIQPAFTDPKDGPQKGCKWYISTYATKSEVIQTALKATLACLEHEAREKFTYRGVAIFGPHFNVDVLHEMASSHMLDSRKSKA